ncbi:MAG: HK97 family phage prohead protease [Actinomycetota bacterium]|nr:HK97 family phage prohead protease [Actinomycetota bacterium]
MDPTEAMKQKAVERRTLFATDADAEAAPSGKKRISGYGSLYDVEVEIEGWFASWIEMVAQGAWKKTIDDSERIVSTFNHNVDLPLGATDSGTLELTDDETGLFYSVDINPDDPFAVAVWSRVKRGDVSGASVWFRVTRQEWVEATDGEPEKRIILEADLYEVGPVVMPAFVDTSAEAASAMPRRIATPTSTKEDERARRLSGLLDRVMKGTGA